jgi:tol-pal system protein YbgF
MAVLFLGIGLSGCVTKRDIEEVKDQLTRVESQNRETSRLIAKVDSLISMSAVNGEAVRADVRQTSDNLQAQFDALLANYNELINQLNLINRELRNRKIISGSVPGPGDAQMPGGGQPTTATTPTAPPPSVVQPTIDCDSSYDAAFVLARQEAYDEAVDGFRNFLAECPNHDNVPDAYFWIGELYFRQENYGRAISEFEHLVNTYKQSPKVAPALYKVARCQHEQGKTADAKKTYQRIIDEFPGSTEAKQAQERLNEM